MSISGGNHLPGIARIFESTTVDDPAAPTQAAPPQPDAPTPPAPSLRPASFGIQTALIGDIIKQAASTVRAAALRATIEANGATLTPDQAKALAEEIKNDTTLTDDDRRGVQAALLGKVNTAALDEIIFDDSLAMILATDENLQQRFGELGLGQKMHVLETVMDDTALSPDDKGWALGELISATEPADLDNLFQNLELNNEHTQVLDLLSRSPNGRLSSLLRGLTPENTAAVREVYERLAERASDPADGDRALAAGDVVQAHVANQPADWRETYRAERKRLQEE